MEWGQLNSCMHSLTRNGFHVTGYLPGMEHKINPRAVTTDEEGHLFVCDDYNDCLQMFSTDGRYLGAMLRQGAQGSDAPCGPGGAETRTPWSWRM